MLCDVSQRIFRCVLFLEKHQDSCSCMVCFIDESVHCLKVVCVRDACHSNPTQKYIQSMWIEYKCLHHQERDRENKDQILWLVNKGKQPLLNNSKVYQELASLSCSTHTHSCQKWPKKGFGNAWSTFEHIYNTCRYRSDDTKVWNLNIYSVSTTY